MVKTARDLPRRCRWLVTDRTRPAAR